MAMMKAGLAGAAIGALGLATVMFIAPIAAQAPGGPPAWGDGWRGQGGPGGRPRGDDFDMRGPGAMGQGQGRGDITGPGPMRPGQGRGDATGPGGQGRPGGNPADDDITGPRGSNVTACQERLTEMARSRLARVQRLVRPADEQRGAFEELRIASVKALDIMRAACAAERPLTPPARMEAAEKWLEARLQAIKTMRPALDNFYKVLSDEQKVRWSLGERFGHHHHHMRPSDRPGQDGERGMHRGYGGSGAERPDQWGERPGERYGRERQAAPPERYGNRYEDERSQRPPERWGDRRRDDDRGDWRDNRRRPQGWDGRSEEDDDEERL
jgi:LTXXQ motif family protein